MRHSRFLFLLPFLGLLLLNGCTGYQLGSQLPSDIQSVYVPTVINQTSEPLLENEVTRAILGQLQRDGSLSITSEKDADAILYVTLTSYNVFPLAFSRENRSLPNEYRLTLGASAELIRQDNGKVLARDGDLIGRDDFGLSGDFTSAKELGLPGVAEDLARYIVAAITEAWPD